MKYLCKQHTSRKQILRFVNYIWIFARVVIFAKNSVDVWLGYECHNLVMNLFSNQVGYMLEIQFPDINIKHGLKKS